MVVEAGGLANGADEEEVEEGMVDAAMGGSGGDLIVSDVVVSGLVPISSRKPNCNSFGTFSSFS